MARSIDEIQSQIIAQVQATPELAGATSASRTARWRLWTFLVSVALNLHEQLWDLLRERLEKIAASAVTGTAAWLQTQVFKFRYGQQVELIDFVPQYSGLKPNGTPYTDEEIAAALIVTRCAVRQNDQDRMISIKVAKGQSPLAPLDGPEKEALVAYLSKIKFAGTHSTVISTPPDRIYIPVTVNYDAEYVQSTVKTNVIAAINDYFKTLEFDGAITLSKIEDAVQSVDGVFDVSFPDGNVQIRDYATTFVLGANTQIARRAETVAGYVIPEDSTGFTLDDSVTMTLGQ